MRKFLRCCFEVCFGQLIELNKHRRDKQEEFLIFTTTIYFQENIFDILFSLNTLNNLLNRKIKLRGKRVSLQLKLKVKYNTLSKILSQIHYAVQLQTLINNLDYVFTR